MNKTIKKIESLVNKSIKLSRQFKTDEANICVLQANILIDQLNSKSEVKYGRFGLYGQCCD